MLTIENIEVVGWEPALRGMRNPKNSWENSDSKYCVGDLSCGNDNGCELLCKSPPFVIGPKDYKLMMDLRNAGPDHRKFMRFLVVYLDITAPLYWWKEFETYRVGVYPNPTEIEINSCSTMHKIHEKELTFEDFSTENFLARSVTTFSDVLSDLNYNREKFIETGDKKYWWQLIQMLPSSYNQRRTLMVNYEVLANIYSNPGRRYHKLDEWKTLCQTLELMPCSGLITGERNMYVQGRTMNDVRAEAGFPPIHTHETIKVHGDITQTANWNVWGGWRGNHDKRIEGATCSNCGCVHPDVQGSDDPDIGNLFYKICPTCFCHMILVKEI